MVKLDWEQAVENANFSTAMLYTVRVRVVMY
jgi:hypothetical protein